MSDEDLSRAHARMRREVEAMPRIREGVAVKKTDAESVYVTAPPPRSPLRRALRTILRLPEKRGFELTVYTAEVFARCDGEHTVEDIIKDFMEKWQLSFFEARGLVLNWLQDLVKHELVAIQPGAVEEEPGGENPA